MLRQFMLLCVFCFSEGGCLALPYLALSSLACLTFPEAKSLKEGLWRVFLSRRGVEVRLLVLLRATDVRFVFFAFG